MARIGSGKYALSGGNWDSISDAAKVSTLPSALLRYGDSAVTILSLRILEDTFRVNHTDILYS